MAGFLPVLMVVSNRSSAAVLSVAAVAALLAALLTAGLRPTLDSLMGRIADPLILGVIGLIVWCHVTVLWSDSPGSSLFELYGVLVPLLATLVLGVFLVPRAPAFTTSLIAIALVIATIAICIEVKDHFPLSRSLGIRADPTAFNRPTLTLLILLWPAIALLRAHRRPILAVALAAVVALTIGVSHSGTSVIAFAISVVAFGAALLAPMLCLAAAAATIVLLFALAPWIGDLAGRLAPHDLNAALRTIPDHGFSAMERIEIWKSFDAVIPFAPWFGHGFGSSRWMGDTLASRVAEPLRTSLSFPHPHEMFLQIWVELGCVGVVLSAALGLAALYRLSRLPADRLPSRFALVAASIFIAAVSHGVWQAWWIAALGAAIVLFEIADRTAAERVSGVSHGAAMRAGGKPSAAPNPAFKPAKSKRM